MLGLICLVGVVTGGPERTGLRTCEIPYRGVNWVADMRGPKPTFPSPRCCHQPLSQ